jgi:hypothetical protein
MVTRGIRWIERRKNALPEKYPSLRLLGETVRGIVAHDDKTVINLSSLFQAFFTQTCHNENSIHPHFFDCPEAAL